MKNKKGFFFGAAILAIYIITVLSYGLSLFTEYRSAPSKAEFRFSELVRETSANLKINSPRSEAFVQTFLRSVGTVSDFSGLQLVQDGELILSYPKAVSGTNGHMSALMTTKSTDLRASDGSVVTLTAAIYLLKPNSIKNKGLMAFAVILFATLCCVVYLILSFISDRPKKEPPETTPDPDDDKSAPENESTEEPFQEPDWPDNLDSVNPPDDSAGLDQEIFENEDEKNFLEGNEPKQEPETDSAADQEKDSPDESDDGDMGVTPFQITSNITQEEYQALTKDLIPSNETALTLSSNPDRVLPPEKMVLKPLPPLESVKKQEEKKEDAPKKRPVPEGLFSSITGFCWEEYMIPRLDSELMRAASSDQDIALLTISIPKLDWSSDAGQTVCALIQDAFKFRDMIFEYKDSGCTAILQGLSRKQVLQKAENLHTDIIAELAKRYEYYIVSIGIANRALRLISGSRLANESEQALLRAQSDTDSPIVEFKIDYDKYKNFITEEASRMELSNKVQF